MKVLSYAALPLLAMLTGGVVCADTAESSSFQRHISHAVSSNLRAKLDCVRFRNVSQTFAIDFKTQRRNRFLLTAMPRSPIIPEEEEPLILGTQR